MSYMPDNCAPRDGVGIKHDKALLKATSSVIHSGLLFKKGKIVRSWKQRKFVLDTAKGEVNNHCAVTCTCTCTFQTQNASFHLQLSYLEDDRTQGRYCTVQPQICLLAHDTQKVLNQDNMLTGSFLKQILPDIHCRKGCS